MREKTLERNIFTSYYFNLRLYNKRFDEILETINSRESLLDEFDEQIFNALVEKIEVFTPTHFAF